jgi:hypothetical protein
VNHIQLSAARQTVFNDPTHTDEAPNPSYVTDQNVNLFSSEAVLDVV